MYGIGAQRREVLDRLVRRAVLAQADRVVRPDVDDGQAHDAGQPHRRPHVVGEHEERGAEGAEAAVHGEAVEDRAHAVLADAEVERAAAEPSGQHRVGLGVLLVGERGARHVLGALDRGRRGRREVGRAADELGDRRREGLDARARALARRLRARRR